MKGRSAQPVGTLVAGTDDGFSDFYREAYPGAVRLAWLLTHDHAAADDVVQDAFVRLRPRFLAVEHRTTYLRGAIVAGCRARGRSAGRADGGRRRIRVVTEVSSPDEAAELLDAIGHLPYKQRAVLVLRYWADLSEEEVAEVVGMRPAAVRSITSRALDRLRKELPDGH